MNLGVVLAVVAITIALLVWALVDIGTRLLQAWRERFTRETGFHLRELFLFVDPARLYVLNLALTLLGVFAAYAWQARRRPAETP